MLNNAAKRESKEKEEEEGKLEKCFLLRAQVRTNPEREKKKPRLENDIHTLQIDSRVKMENTLI